MNTKKRNKKQMSVGVQMKYRYTLTGIGWMLCGVFELISEFFDDPISIVALFISMVCLLAALYFTYKVDFSRKEISDEMAEYHLMKAKSTTLVQLYILISCVFLLMFFFKYFTPDAAINLGSIVKPILAIVLGLLNLLIGLNFHRLEAE